jgi:hypothetical protein
VSLNDLPFEEANTIKKAHIQRNLSKCGFYAQDEYLVHRRHIEQWLMQQLLKKGGTPKETVPVYMTLGPSPEGKFDIRQNMHRHRIEIIIPLAELDMNTVTFTYPDCMYKLIEGQNGAVIGVRTNTPRIYQYHELDDVISKYRIYDQYTHYIEAQVWDREPLYRLWRRKHAPKGIMKSAHEKQAIAHFCLCSGDFCKNSLSHE